MKKHRLRNIGGGILVSAGLLATLLLGTKEARAWDYLSGPKLERKVSDREYERPAIPIQDYTLDPSNSLEIIPSQSGIENIVKKQELRDYPSVEDLPSHGKEQGTKPHRNTNTKSDKKGGVNGEVSISEIYGQKYPANPDFSSAAKYIAGIELGYTFNVFPISIRPYTKINTLMDKRMGFNYHPAGAQFFMGVEIEYKKLFMQLEHMCWHPIDTEGHVYQYDMLKLGARFGK